MPSGNYGSRGSRYDYEELVECAIEEVKKQLERQGGIGSVWVDEWKEWYQRDLGTLRQFLESKPSLFRVVPEGDRKYHVELASYRGKGGGKGRKGGYGDQGYSDWSGGGPSGGRSGPRSMGFGWGQGGGFWSKTTADAIKEIKSQLLDQGGHGKVWVDHWPRKFQPELGTMRQFLEARWDKFEVHPGRGNSFTVSLKGYEKESTAASSKGKSDTKSHTDDSKPPVRQKKSDSNKEKGGKRWKLKETDATAAAAAQEDEEYDEEEEDEEGGERPSAFDDKADDLDD